MISHRRGIGWTRDQLNAGEPLISSTDGTIPAWTPEWTENPYGKAMQFPQHIPAWAVRFRDLNLLYRRTRALVARRH